MLPAGLDAADRQMGEQHVRQKNSHREDNCQIQRAESAERTGGSRTPDRGRCVEPANVRAIFENHSRSEEAHWAVAVRSLWTTSVAIVLLLSVS